MMTQSGAGGIIDCLGSCVGVQNEGIPIKRSLTVQ